MNKAAEWLIQKRNSKNLSLRELASKVNLSHATIAKAEEGNASFDTWTTLANYFNENPQVVLAWAGLLSPADARSELANRAAHLIDSMEDNNKQEGVRYLEYLYDKSRKVINKRITE